MFVLSSPLVFARALILKHLGSKMMCALPPTFLDVGKNRELSSELLVLQSLTCAPRQLFSLALPEYTCELQALSSDDHVWLSWTKKLGGETVCVTTRPTKTALRAKGLVFPNTWPDPVICLRVFDFASRFRCGTRKGRSCESIYTPLAKVRKSIICNSCEFRLLFKMAPWRAWSKSHTKWRRGLGGAGIPPNRADDKAYLTNTGFGLRSHALS